MAQVVQQIGPTPQELLRAQDEGGVEFLDGQLVEKPVYPKDPTHLLRIFDESGEDYLYPRDWFAPVELPPKAKRAISAAIA